jgi:hypothetical protein
MQQDQSVSQPCLLARAESLLHNLQKFAAIELKLFLSGSNTAMDVDAGTGSSPDREHPLANSTLSFGRCLIISKLPFR